MKKCGIIRYTTDGSMPCDASRSYTVGGDPDTVPPLVIMVRHVGRALVKATAWDEAGTHQSCWSGSGSSISRRPGLPSTRRADATTGPWR